MTLIAFYKNGDHLAGCLETRHLYASQFCTHSYFTYYFASDSRHLLSLLLRRWRIQWTVAWWRAGRRWKPTTDTWTRRIERTQCIALRGKPNSRRQRKLLTRRKTASCWRERHSSSPWWWCGSLKLSVRQRLHTQHQQPYCCSLQMYILKQTSDWNEWEYAYRGYQFTNAQHFKRLCIRKIYHFVYDQNQRSSRVASLVYHRELDRKLRHKRNKNVSLMARPH